MRADRGASGAGGPAFAALLLLLGPAAFGQIWDVGDTGRAGQRTVDDRTANGSAIGLPVAAGDLDLLGTEVFSADLDGDGFADAIGNALGSCAER